MEGSNPSVLGSGSKGLRLYKYGFQALGQKPDLALDVGGESCRCARLRRPWPIHPKIPTRNLQLCGRNITIPMTKSVSCSFKASSSSGAKAPRFRTSR